MSAGEAASATAAALNTPLTVVSRSRRECYRTDRGGGLSVSKRQQEQLLLRLLLHAVNTTLTVDSRPKRGFSGEGADARRGTGRG
ncbi:hypothetical protein CLOM_g7909 [Closterium sp. NIES-68]|nr:hypothetical protein CLOM_g7909 [Closterium sp. NIES-68]GJP58245.1 hypothetical protein CLOP_g22711 [Closterium sp. NIES-67]